MPRYNVEYNGKWACFSSVVDAFVMGFTDKNSYEEWRKREYGAANHKPAEQCNMMNIDEAVFSASLNRSRDEWASCLLESGLSQQKVEQLIYDCETKYYCPKLNEIGQHECPNCHAIVAKNQTACINERCEIKLIWR